MTRPWIPALCSLAASAAVCCAWVDRSSAGAGLAAALPPVVLSQILFARTLRSSWGAFGAAFGGVFASHAACAGALLAICWTTPLQALPALSSWAAGVFAGTLAVGLMLPWKPVAEAAHAR